MNIDNQTDYWNSVAQNKLFTHPIDIKWMRNYENKESVIIDYGCGYGRIVKELMKHGFSNVKGFDSAVKLINRGRNDGLENIFHIDTLDDLPCRDNSVDCFLLFAVLTCIPSNSAQSNLISILRNKLKPDGIIYISDYYLQLNSIEMERYEYLNDDKQNYGIFKLQEDVIFRHHTKEWINILLKDFKILEETLIDVKTMNGNQAEAFQMIVSK